MEAKFDKQAIEVQSVKSAVDRIVIALASRGTEPSGSDAALPFPIPPFHPMPRLLEQDPQPLSPGPLPNVPKIFPPKNSTKPSLGVVPMMPLCLQTLWQMPKLSCLNGKLQSQLWLQNVIWPQVCLKSQGTPWAAGLRSVSLEIQALQLPLQSNAWIPINWVGANIRSNLFFPPITIQFNISQS